MAKKITDFSAAAALTGAEIVEVVQSADNFRTTITLIKTFVLSVFSAFGLTLGAAADASAARTTLGLVIGTNVQAYDAELAAVAGLTSAADKVPYFTGSGAAALADFSATGRSLVDDASTSAMRTTLGVAIGSDVQAYDAELAAIAGLTSAADKLPYFTGSGAAALADFSATGRSLVDDASTSAMRTTLGLVIGTNVQAQDAELAALAGLTSAADKLPYFTGSGTAALADFTTAGRALVDDASASAQRTTLGLVIGTDVQAQDAELAAIAGLTSAADKLPYFTGSGTAALTDLSSTGRSLIDDASTSAMRTTLGLGNVDDTSDATKNAASVSLTNKNLTSGTNTFPTLNQNTSGSAATLTTARTIDGQSFDGSANITVIAPGTHAATGKTTPVDADELPLVDSAASNVLKKLTWANLKATLKTYLDTLYVALGTVQSYTPTVSAASGTLTTTSSTGSYYDVGPLRFYQMKLTITTNGTGSLGINGSLPSTPLAGTLLAATGRETAISGSAVYGALSGATALILFTKNDLYPGGDGRVIELSGWYRTA